MDIAKEEHPPELMVLLSRVLSTLCSQLDFGTDPAVALDLVGLFYGSVLPACVNTLVFAQRIMSESSLFNDPVALLNEIESRVCHHNAAVIIPVLCSSRPPPQEASVQSSLPSECLLPETPIASTPGHLFCVTVKENSTADWPPYDVAILDGGAYSELFGAVAEYKHLSSGFAVKAVPCPHAAVDSDQMLALLRVLLSLRTRVEPPTPEDLSLELAVETGIEWTTDCDELLTEVRRFPNCAVHNITEALEYVFGVHEVKGAGMAARMLAQSRLVMAVPNIRKLMEAAGFSERDCRVILQ